MAGEILLACSFVFIFCLGLIMGRMWSFPTKVNIHVDHVTVPSIKTQHVGVPWGIERDEPEDKPIGQVIHMTDKREMEVIEE